MDRHVLLCFEGHNKPSSVMEVLIALGTRCTNFNLVVLTPFQHMPSDRNMENTCEFLSVELRIESFVYYQLPCSKKKRITHQSVLLLHIPPPINFAIPYLPTSISKFHRIHPSGVVLCPI